MRYCNSCGTLISDETAFCPSCGAAQYSSKGYEAFRNERPKSRVTYAMVRKGLFIVVCALTVLAVIWLQLRNVEKRDLQRGMQGVWRTAEGAVLEVADNMLRYTPASGGPTVSYDYIVVNGDEISVSGRKIAVLAEGGQMMLTPGLGDGNKTEAWSTDD